MPFLIKKHLVCLAHIFAHYIFFTQIFKPPGASYIVDSLAKAVKETNMSGNAKSIVSTDRAWYINDHHRAGYCKIGVVRCSYMVDLKMAQLNHYREVMDKDVSKKNVYVYIYQV